jgi:hypothetical protein
MGTCMSLAHSPKFQGLLLTVKFMNTSVVRIPHGQGRH